MAQNLEFLLDGVNVPLLQLRVLRVAVSTVSANFFSPSDHLVLLAVLVYQTCHIIPILYLYRPLLLAIWSTYGLVTIWFVKTTWIVLSLSWNPIHVDKGSCLCLLNFLPFFGVGQVLVAEWFGSNNYVYGLSRLLLLDRLQDLLRLGPGDVLQHTFVVVPNPVDILLFLCLQRQQPCFLFLHNNLVAPTPVILLLLCLYVGLPLQQ